MAGMLLSAKSNKPGASSLTIIDPAGSTTGYRMLGAPDWGNVAWDVLYSGPRGTQGARAAGAIPQSRVIAFSLRIDGSTKDDALAKFSTLATLCDELRRFGGTITWRSKNATFRQHFDVMSGNAAVDTWPARSEHSNIIECTVSAVCAPYLKGDPMDILDEFSSDSITAGDYTFDAGASGNVAVTGGELDAAANFTTENRAIHTATGYSYGDHQVTVKTTPGATISSYKAGVILKRIDASNYLIVYVDDNGTNSRLRLDKVVASVTTNLSTTNLAARIVTGTPLWIRGRLEGNVVFLEHLTSTPTPMGTPTTSASYTLAGAEVTSFGASAVGKAGFVWISQETTAKMDDFDVDPFTYRNVTLPGEL